MKNKITISAFLLSIMIPVLGVFAVTGLPVIKVGTRAESAKMVMNDDAAGIDKEESYAIMEEKKGWDLEKNEQGAIAKDENEEDVIVKNEMFLKIEGIDGESTDERREEVDQEEEMAKDADTDSDKWRYEEDTIKDDDQDKDKEESYGIDRSTPDLMLHCVKGECDMGDKEESLSADFKVGKSLKDRIKKDDDCNGDDCDVVLEKGEADLKKMAEELVNLKSVSEEESDNGKEEAYVTAKVDVEIEKEESYGTSDEKHEDWIEILSYAKNDIEWEYTPIDNKGKAGLKLEDENGGWIEILSVKGGEDETGKISGTQTKSFLGIFDINLSVKADVDAKGNLSNIDKPWYSFLTW